MNTLKISERLAELEARSTFDLGRDLAERVAKQLTDEEKSILVGQYVHDAYGNLPGWDFTNLDADYGRVSARVEALRKEASNGL